MSNHILDQLNESQRQAVDCIDGPMMVIAGAGSGKTRVLTFRVAYLIEKGIDPFNILCLTFTNKAAREMKDRIIRLIGPEARNVWMGTFHSVFARILRIDGHLLGYPSSFTIYDMEDAKNLIRKILKDISLDPKIYVPGQVLSRISAAKSNLISAGDYLNNPEIMNQDITANRPKIGEIYGIYQGRLFRSGAMDFDDLLFNTNILLRDFPDVLYKYQEKFRYILVDEYQDTNYSQYIIVKKLASRYLNLCVVGDDAQSIYAFRGANIQNILNFRSDYPEFRLFKLEQNYRSTQNIVNAANSIIAQNKDQIHKIVWTHNEEGPAIKLMKAASDNEEGTLVATGIFELKMNLQLQNSDFAVLYRTNAQSRALEEALRRINIPYRIYGGLSFYARKEIKDLLSYFRLAVNLNDEEALRRIINYPVRGIGESSLQKIEIVAGQSNLPIWLILENLQSYHLDLMPRAVSAISNFVALIKSFQAQVYTRSAAELAQHIAKSSGLIKELEEDKTIEGQGRLDNLEELLNAVQDFTEREPTPEEELEGLHIRRLDEFMQEVSLLTDADTDDDTDKNKVSLMTIHQAKGLEFPYVFISGMEENLFPSFMSIGSRSDLEEERRLFYVALTRAEKKVTLSYAETRYKWGNLQISEPSRFIDEIDQKYVERPQRRSSWNSSAQEPEKNVHKPKTFPGTTSPQPASPGKNYKKIASYSDSPDQLDAKTLLEKGGDDYGQILPGVQVEHSKFGKGTVKTVEGAGPNKKATVLFVSVGAKQLLLRFAKLVVLNS